MIGRGATFLLAACVAAFLNSCGSGAVSSETDPTVAFAVSPSSATTYSGVPATFAISGGGARAPYQLTSSNATLLPVPATPISDSQFVLTPGAVTAQQSVTISVKDQAGKTATSTVSIQPNLINGDITITGSAPPAFPACASAGAVCAGQSGTASLTVSQNGAPARGRSVRFDVAQGNFRFPVDVAQTTFATSVTVTSDESGRVMTVLRANAGSPSQIATIRATDVATGAFRIATFFIKQAIAGGGEFVTIPPEWKISGAYKGKCPGGTVDYLIFGGTPPYAIRSAAPLIADATPARTAIENPSRFTVSFAEAACGTGGYQVIFTVTDATGLSIQPVLTNTPGPDDAPALPPIITLSPSEINVDCNQSAQVLVTITNPGTTAPTISASVGTSSETSALLALVADNVVTVVRGPGAVGTNPATITVGAGSATPQAITVNTPLSCP